ncbi:MAG: FtsX-like permease family protein [Treponemataceae bacterium]
MIFKLALRNLLANKAKTWIIVGIIALATFLSVLGFGILDYSLKQTKDVCREDFCGDIFISGKSSEKDVIATLLGPVTFGVTFEMPEMPYLLQTDKIIEKLKSIDTLADFSKGIASSGYLKPDDDDEEDEAFSDISKLIHTTVLGIEPNDHKRMYNSIKISDGEFPTGGEFFIMSSDAKEEYEKVNNTSLKIGDKVFFQSFTGKAKTLPLKITAFYEYAHPETVITRVCYCDFNSVRILNDMTLGSQTANEIPDSIDLSVSDLSEEELFSESFSFEENTQDYSDTETETDLMNILGDTSLRDSLNMPDAESWHYITIKLKDTNKTASIIKELNTWFSENEIEAQASAWDTAMKPYAMNLVATKWLLITILALLSIVSLVVIMNTLVVSAMERTSEIGTMRAIGAKKSFVRKMFMSESIMLAVGGLLIGVVIAVIFAIAFNSSGGVGINKLAETFFGVSAFRVNMNLKNILVPALVIIFASIIATIYPLAVAMDVSPLEAINKE